jgi:hypothetical protein
MQASGAVSTSRMNWKYASFDIMFVHAKFESLLRGELGSAQAITGGSARTRLAPGCTQS